MGRTAQRETDGGVSFADNYPDPLAKAILGVVEVVQVDEGGE